MSTHGSPQAIVQNSVADSVSAERLMIDLDSELLARLRRTAQAQDQSIEQLVAVLLARGLEQEALRARIQVALKTLTPREREVALLASRGLTNRQIASELVISPETVKTHIRHGLAKFELNSKFELRLLLKLGSVG